MDLVQNDLHFKNRRVKIINLPALNENEESNFEYDYGVGFNTEYYKQRRASFERNNDTASWSAQYMGQPIERDGTLFNYSDFRYFNGALPDVQCDRVFMAIDPAWGGGDYVAEPICCQYGEDIFVVDVVFNNNSKEITQPLIASKIIKHNVGDSRIETTKMTDSYRKDIKGKRL